MDGIGNFKTNNFVRFVDENFSIGFDQIVLIYVSLYRKHIIHKITIKREYANEVFLTFKFNSEMFVVYMGGKLFEIFGFVLILFG